MNKHGSGSKAWMWFVAAILATFMGGCSPDGIFGSPIPVSPPGPVPGAPPGAIPPGAPCVVAAGPTIPTVTSSDPSNGNLLATTSTSGVAGGGKLITATFSLAMNGATLTPATFTLAPVGQPVLVPASVTYTASTRVATLTTSSALLPNTSYTAIITQGAVTAADGTPLSCTFAWNFSTGAAATGLAPIHLGLAAPFGIAAAAGVTNDLATNPPNTTINGNVVLSPTPTCNAVPVDAAGGFGLCGGIAPALNGQVISPLFDPGGNLATIKSDLLAAYNSILAANLPGATVLGCGTIGTGGGAGAGIGCAGNATLPPGVYISATASSIGVTGVLTLNGQGDADAKFVFQMPSSTLTTAAGAPGVPGSEIVLINGAKASNVFWQVGSSATIGTFAVFRGNVLADTTITMGDQSTSCGRLLAGAVTATGAFTFDGNLVSVPGHVNAPAGCQ